MTGWDKTLAGGAALAAAPALVLPFSESTRLLSHHPAALPYIFAALAVGVFSRLRALWPLAATTVLAGFAALSPLAAIERAGAAYWLLLLSAWLQTWLFAGALSRRHSFLARVAPPLLFGAALLVAWEAITRGANVSPVLAPPPSAIAARIASELPVLFADFRQTVLKGALTGYVIGCLSGLAVAVAVDRVPFLRRGLLPLGDFVSALPIIGVAPIMVMWFGFDWPSKAAVVVLMTFFPMLVNAVAGLRDHSPMESDLMSTYAAGYRARLFKLALPASLPFVFNALKINSTLALIGAIVAEFFGTPIVGMGFRISTEVGRMNLDMVWAEIAVAALTGTAFYGILALLERRLAFWHPSVRSAD